jgi:Zn-dependent protease
MINLFNSFGPAIAISLAFIIIGSICFHEVCHVVAAHYQGDDTAIENGYLTFNPLKLMGVMSLIVFAIAGIAWGAVPVDPRRFRHKWSDVVVSLAGPAANLLLFAIFAIAAASNFQPSADTNLRIALNLNSLKDLLGDIGSQSPLTLTFMLGSAFNLALAAFNLLPVPPLDGFSLTRHFFPGVLRSMEKSEILQIIYIVIAFALFYLSSGLITVGFFCSSVLIYLLLHFSQLL